MASQNHEWWRSPSMVKTLNYQIRRVPEVLTVYRDYKLPQSDIPWGWVTFVARGLAMGVASAVLFYVGWRVSRG